MSDQMLPTRKMGAYLIDSGGQFTKLNSPLLLAGAADPAEYQQVLKAVTDPSAGSRKLRQKFGITINGVLCAPRPFDFSLYAYAQTLNTYHARACRAKAKDIAGRGWNIVGEGSEPKKKELTTFFRTAFGRETFSRGMGRVWSDYEGLGNGFLEIVPARKGNEPAAFAHLPATQMWIRLDGLGYVQQLGAEYSHFRDFLASPDAYSELPVKDPLAAEDVTSVMHFSRYSAWSPYYGIPSIMPAWPALCMMTLISEFNLRYFSNNAIPDYVVMVEGDAGEETVATIREYFRTHIQGQAHKTLILEGPSGTKITFQSLQAANKEGAFRLMRQDCRDEILAAHGVPPQKVGVVETGKLGGNLASEQIEEYKNSIVTPGQEDLSTGMNAVIERGFGIEGLSFQFDEYDLADEAVNATVDGTYLDRNVLLPNEVRTMRFPKLKPLPDGDEPLKPATLADLAGLEDQIAEIQKLVRKAVQQ